MIDRQLQNHRHNQSQMPNICRFNKFAAFLSVLYNCKFNIFEFWTVSRTK